MCESTRIRELSATRSALFLSVVRDFTRLAIQGEKRYMSVFSSAQPRAIQTALAIFDDVIDETWLNTVMNATEVYTDCRGRGVNEESSLELRRFA